MNVLILSGHGFRHSNGDPIFVMVQETKLRFVNVNDLGHDLARNANTLNVIIANFCDNDLPPEKVALVAKYEISLNLL